QSGIGRYDTEQLTVHMVQHLLLGMAVPLAAVCAAPVTLVLQSGGLGTKALLRRALRSRAGGIITHPVVTWALFGGGLVVIYLTPVLGLSARHPWVHLLVHVHLVVSGSLFLAGLVGVDPSPHPMPYGARLLAVLVAVPFHAFLGLAIVTTRAPLAPSAYPSLSDQHTAGGLLWGMGELFTLVVSAIVFRHWYVYDQREAVRADRRADNAEAARLEAEARAFDVTPPA
ncbi:MAG TPA: cytochrome c oxidase assembly protein, partial [Acidimicrobiales bacterium]